MAAELIAVFFGSVLVLTLHEVGHVIGAQLCQVPISSVRIGVGPDVMKWVDLRGTSWVWASIPLGGSCRYPTKILGTWNAVTPDLRSSLQSFAIILSGPMLNIVAGCILLGICIPFDRSDCSFSQITQSNLAPIYMLAAFSLAVGVFNLLPVPPLDGGQILLTLVEYLRRERMSNSGHRKIRLLGRVGLSGKHFNRLRRVGRRTQ